MAAAIILYIVLIGVLLRRPKGGANPPGPGPIIYNNKYNAKVANNMQHAYTGYLIYDDGTTQAQKEEPFWDRI